MEPPGRYRDKGTGDVLVQLNGAWEHESERYRHRSLANAEEPIYDREGKSIIWLFRNLIALRRREPVFRSGGYYVRNNWEQHLNQTESKILSAGWYPSGKHIIIKELLMKAIGEFLISMVMGLCYVCTAGSVSLAATYYIRTDGGTSVQCTGQSDAPYPGSGQNQPCAWSHPFWALESGEPPTWKLQGGDTLIIYPGSYRMGYGAPNSDWCDESSPWDCRLPPLPSGPDSDHPTRILGSGWDQGCTEPPELWGTERPDAILNLQGSSHIVIGCMEITDHSSCVEDHADSQVACERDTFPFGDWAPYGIYAADSSHVVLQDLNIHGLAWGGVHAGRLSNWVVKNVRIAGNGGVGWDGDLWEGSDSNSGTLSFENLTVEWNGCAETYPEKQPANCWAQPVGGYGDGMGVGYTGGRWKFFDSTFRYNTSDGLDLLYVTQADSFIEVIRSKAYGNAGDQIKLNGSAAVENCLIVSNCSFFRGQSFAPDINGTYPIDDCRSGGAALPLFLMRGDTVSVVNSTIAGQGDCLGSVLCEAEDAHCDGSETIIVQNNIFQGYQEFSDPSDQSCLYYILQKDFSNVFWDYNVIHNVKIGDYMPPLGSHDIRADPLFVNNTLDAFDGRLQANSPAIDAGLPVGGLEGRIPDKDLTGASRPSGTGVDIGAYEYSAVESITIDGGYRVTSELWVKAILQPAAGPVNLIWKEVGTDTTPSGDRVISGYFYASPDAFAFGSVYNPELFVKIYIATNGWCNIAFNHVTVDSVRVSSAHQYSGAEDNTGTVTLDNRLEEHQYEGVRLQ